MNVPSSCAAHAAAPKGGPLRPPRGLSLIELVVTMAIVAILVAIALPSYKSSLQRSSREAVQAQLIELAAVQEKIYLNSNAYTNKVTDAYTGSSTGGLGVTGGKSADGRYTLTVTVTAASFTLKATPVTGSSQAGDGSLTITSTGGRTWGSKTW